MKPFICHLKALNCVYPLEVNNLPFSICLKCVFEYHHTGWYQSGTTALCRIIFAVFRMYAVSLWDVSVTPILYMNTRCWWFSSMFLIFDAYARQLFRISQHGRILKKMIGCPIPSIRPLVEEPGLIRNILKRVSVGTPCTSYKLLACCWRGLFLLCTSLHSLHHSLSLSRSPSLIWETEVDKWGLHYKITCTRCQVILL